MLVKGTAIKTLPEFIELKSKDKYSKWIENISSQSKDI